MHSSETVSCLLATVFLTAMVLSACGGQSAPPSAHPADASPTADSGSDAASDDAANEDAGSEGAANEDADLSDASDDAASYPPFDAANDDDADGLPTRDPTCTTVRSMGQGLSELHGRLDGYVVAIVPLNGPAHCNSDSTHVHLQVLMGGAVYDVAVNADTNLYETDMDLPDGPWSEGWNTVSDTLDYPSLGIHTSDFVTSPGVAAMAARLEGELADVNHVSIFCTGYGPDGCHDVHREGTGSDGAIFIEPLSSPAHMLAFSFSTDTPF